METFLSRMLRAAKLDAALYEEVEADRTAIWQAATVVVLSSIAAGVGTITEAGMNGILIGTAAALVGWCVWAYIVFIVGTKVLPEPQTQADYGELLRTLGFASAPGIIRVMGVIPGFLWPVTLAAMVWMIAAMIVAVRQALDYQSTFRAVGVCVIGWIIQVIFMILVFAIFGGPGPAA
ncbi:MAG: hypothetical protein JW736_03475 [Deltaproteobacteria bacterium]|nr:hypothetical protein [Deltaproteobacteria bacterium]